MALHVSKLSHGATAVSRNSAGEFRQPHVVAAPPQGALLAVGLQLEFCEGPPCEARAMRRDPITFEPSAPVTLVAIVQNRVAA